MYHDEGKMRAKVLSELVHHVMSLHGAGKSPPAEIHAEGVAIEKPHDISANLPKPDGLPKFSHEDSLIAPKLEAHGGKIIKDEINHKGSIHEPDMNEHGGEGDHPEEHDLNDLFGRKKGRSRECF